MHVDTLCALEIIEEVINSEGDMVLSVEFKVCDEEAMKITRSN